MHCDCDWYWLRAACHAQRGVSAFTLAVLVALLVTITDMPHLRSATSRRLRLARAVELGFWKPTPDGKRHVLVDEADAGRVKDQADAISMGLGDALSEKAEVDFVKREYERETWEMDTNPAGEVRGSIATPLFSYVSISASLSLLISRSAS